MDISVNVNVVLSKSEIEGSLGKTINWGENYRLYSMILRKMEQLILKGFYVKHELENSSEVLDKCVKEAYSMALDDGRC